MRHAALNEWLHSVASNADIKICGGPKYVRWSTLSTDTHTTIENIPSREADSGSASE